MRRKFNLIGMIVLVILLLLPMMALAAPVGKITQVEGNVDLSRSGQAAMRASVGDPVNQGDILRAKSKSKAEVTFDDGNLLRLAEGTRVRITQYDNQEKKKSYFDLFRGKTQSVVKNLPKGGTFEVHTPTSIAGVRGTILISFYINGVSGAVFKDGSGYGYNRNMPSDVKIIPSGQGMVVTAPNQPPIVKPATSVEIEKHIGDTTPAKDKKDESKKDSSGSGSGTGGTTGTSGSSGTTGDSGTSGTSGTTVPDNTPPGGTVNTETNLASATQTTESTASNAANLNVVTTNAAANTLTEVTTTASQQSNTTTLVTDTTATYTTSTVTLPTTGIFTGGTISSSINNSTNTGTMNVAATLNNTTDTAVTPLQDTMSDGSTFTANLAGIPGSWNGLLRGIYRNGNGIGLLSADLTGDIAGNDLTASGNMTRGSILGQTTDSGMNPLSGINLPTFQNVDLTGAASAGPVLTNAVSGYHTTTGGLVGLWGITTTGGIFNTTGLSSWRATYGFNSPGSYYILGDVSGTDVGTSHVSLSGAMLYMNSQFYGKLDLAYKGIYDAGGAYRSIGTGTYELAPLAHSGSVTAQGSFGGWNSTVTQIMFDNGAGAPLASISGFVGGMASPFGAGYPTASFVGMGTYDAAAVNAGSYPLFRAPVSGTITPPAGISAGYGGQYKLRIGGIRQADAISGGAYGIYAKPTAYNGSGIPTAWEAGTLLSNNVAGTLYPAIGMWQILNTSTLTAAMKQNGIASMPIIVDELSGGSGALKGPIDGNINFKRATASVGGNYLPFGVLYGSYSGTYTNAPATTWTARAGGSDDVATGYWLANLSGTDWNAGSFTTTITNGAHMDRYVTGTIDGGFGAGVYSAGRAQGTIGGTYTETPLIFSTGVTWGSSGYFDTTAGGATYNTMVYGDPAGMSIRGVIGSTTSFIGASAPLSGIGTYSAPGTQPLYQMDLSGGIVGSPSTSTVRLWFGGARNATTAEGKIMGLYANWNSANSNYDVGLLSSGAVTANPYSDIGMWQITSGALTLESKGALSSPTISVPATLRSGVIAGTSGISGVSKGYDMYFASTGGSWGVWRAETGGSYTTVPAAGWTAVAGTTGPDDYSVSHITGTAWSASGLAGTTSGQWLNLSETGTSSGNIMGVDNGNGTWQALAMGKREATQTLAFSSRLTGDMYQVVPGKISTRGYERPYFRSSAMGGWFDPLKYETVYFMKSVGGTYVAVDQSKVIGFEKIQKIMSPGMAGEFVYTDESHYYPNNRWVLIEKGNGVTRATSSGTTGTLAPVPVLSNDPPATPFFTTAGIVANTNPGVTAFTYSDYVKSYETDWLNTNAAVWNGNFTGILGGLSGQSLWTSSSAAKTNVILMGTNDAYSGSQMFDTAMSYSSSIAGAFAGSVTGIIRDTSATGANPLEALAIGIYVDSANKAGIVKGNIAGTSYKSINMWESNDTPGAATLYRDDILNNFTTTVTPLTLLSTDVSGGYTNLARGVMGAGVNSGLYGTFGGLGSIQSPVGVMGHTVALLDQPGWGYFDLKIGAANTYSKPAGSPNTWTATLFGNGMFGKYSSTYADTGYWYTDLTAGTWADSRLAGTITGEFLTFKKKGTLEGALLGTYDTTSWQATAVGAWQKTQDVTFSSEIVGNSLQLEQQKTGSKTDYTNGSTYNYSYTTDGPRPYGESTYFDNGTVKKKTITQFSVEGPPAAEKPYTKNVWVQNYGADNLPNTADDTYTFTSTVYSNLTAYQTAMATMETDPSGAAFTIPSYNQKNFRTSDFSGILAGIGNLWANKGTVTPTLVNPHTSAPTSIALMGDSNNFDQTTFDLFAGKVLSFDPLLTTNPLNDSRTPAVTVSADTAYRGAYAGFIGGVVNSTNNTLSGFHRALYMDKAGNVGLIFSDASLTGSVVPNVGLWKANGDVYTYQMFAQGAATPMIDPAITTTNFASLLVSREEYRSYVPDLAADNVTGGTVSLSTERSQSVNFGNPLYAIWGITQNASGGAYTTTTGSIPTAWSMTIQPPGTITTTSPDTTYVNVNLATPVNNTFSGTVAGAMTHWVDARTSVMGGEIKGIFDPAASTWKAITLATNMCAGTFMNKVNSMTTEAEKQAFVTATKIPAFQVGQADLSGTQSYGTGGSMSVTMAGVTFFAPSTGGDAKIWASAPSTASPTAGVSGSYSNALPTVGIIVPLAQTGTGTNVTGLNASFQINRWDSGIANPKWGATVNGSGSINTTNITLTGGAAGAITPSPATGPPSGSFSGSAAGIVKPALPGI